MRGDQLVWQWRIIQPIEASPIGLAVTEIAQREETGFRAIYQDLKALKASGFSQYTEKVKKANRWAFINIFKFEIPSPFTFYSVISQNATFTEPRTAAWATTT